MNRPPLCKRARLLTIALAGFSFCTYSTAQAYETKPWLEEDLLPKYTLSLYGDGFSCVPTRAKTAPVNGWMAGIGNGFRIAILGEYTLEAEVLASLSTCRDASLEAVRFTARKLLTSDVMADAYSSTTGLTFTAPTNQALRDINRFYYGRYEWELHYAIGREFAPDAEWEHRTWGVGTVGITNQGSPWLRLHLAWEGRLSLTQRLELFLTSEVGLGRHGFPIHAIRSCSRRCCPRHFRGYAPIQYRFVDMGVQYAQEIEDVGDLTFRYAGRAFAYNLPGREHAFYLSLTMPFSL